MQTYTPATQTATTLTPKFTTDGYVARMLDRIPRDGDPWTFEAATTYETIEDGKKQWRILTSRAAELLMTRLSNEAGALTGPPLLPLATFSGFVKDDVVKSCMMRLQARYSQLFAELDEDSDFVDYDPPASWTTSSVSVRSVYGVVTPFIAVVFKPCPQGADSLATWSEYGLR